MPVEPLFIANLSLLKAKLRLTGATQPDTARIIDSAMEAARIGFFDHLGVDRVSELLAIAYSENALTEAALERTKANNLEVSWVRLHLLRVLPSLLMDASGVSQQMWNQENAFARTSDTAKEIERLEAEIAQGLDELASDEDEGGTTQVATLGPTSTWIPGQSVANAEDVS